jgi:cytochrome c551/c552
MRSKARRTTKRGLAAAALFVFAAGTPAMAQTVVDAKAAQALSDQYFCSACHANDRTMVGPGFAAVAKKYKGDAAGQAALAVKVRNGGQGAWGTIPMPPNPGVTDDEMKQLLAWILSLD